MILFGIASHWPTAFRVGLGLDSGVEHESRSGLYKLLKTAITNLFPSNLLCIFWAGFWLPALRRKQLAATAGRSTSRILWQEHAADQLVFGKGWTRAASLAQEWLIYPLGFRWVVQSLRRLEA